ncbi:membrane protein [[Pantoea] beijingensis]|uniref:Membrane protein n=1 Tax=[Pantoea] beijingensis TaxID=1324864 RepID=A0A443IA63_9GAMM|nr:MULTISPECIES: EAL domain-containing protein [Erwiniaceae]RWR00806.1 membrane protein [[Pantoea] beijingensis]
MQILRWLKQFRTHWWGLPFFLPLLLLPLSSQFSARLLLPEGYVYLIYLPLAMMAAMLMVFDWAALPGIILALLCRYFWIYTPGQAFITCLVFIASLLVCWLGYRTHSGKRWRAGFGELSMTPVRLFWLAFFLPTLVVVLYQMMVTMGFVPVNTSIFARDPFTIRALINYQAVLISCITMLQFYYFLIRIIKNPRFARTLWRHLNAQIAEDVPRLELVCWGILLAIMLGALTYVRPSRENLLASDYTLTLLLPLMLWAAMRFGYLLTSISWPMILILLYQFRQSHLEMPSQAQHLAVISSNLLVFTLTIFMMAAIGTRQRRVVNKARFAALIDPVIGLPNLRSLNMTLAANNNSTLCFLRIPELDLLSRTYGLQLRIQYKRNLAAHLKPLLNPGEGVYQLPGFDLVLRLDNASHLTRIEDIALRLNHYQLTWDGLPLQPAVGISFCSVRPPIGHLHELLGEMSAMAEVSLSSGLPENVQQGSLPVQRKIKDRIAMLHEVRDALDSNRFILMAQRIEGLRGDDYHEILLRMIDSHGEHLKPDSFLPVVHEFGLSWHLDRWVLEQTLQFLDVNRLALPGGRFSINLFASTLCRPRLAKEVEELLNHYNVEPWQLIIEVEESHMLSDFAWGNRSINQLRHLGCQVAIDDFGTGYASYVRLKEVKADMLKIDGSFIRNMLASSLDYQIIESICSVARLKRMKVVAEFVETEEVAAALKKMHVDYLQGYAISVPQPLISLAGPAESEPG